MKGQLDASAEVTLNGHKMTDVTVIVRYEVVMTASRRKILRQLNILGMGLGPWAVKMIVLTAQRILLMNSRMPVQVGVE